MYQEYIKEEKREYQLSQYEIFKNRKEEKGNS